MRVRDLTGDVQERRETVNRAQRRALARPRWRRIVALLSRRREAVALHGGPMDGWVVKANAPALRPDWYTTWPPWRATAHEPGRYVRDGPGSASWQS